MTKLMLTVASLAIAAAMISAIVMIANAPAESRPALGPVFHTGPMPEISVNTDQNIGRLTLKFEPAGKAVDRH